MLIATLLLLASTGMASAYCVSVPDTQDSAYLKNGLNRSICLNNELSDTTAIKNWQVEVNTALGQLDRAYVANKLNQIKPTFPDPLKPAWP